MMTETTDKQVRFHAPIPYLGPMTEYPIFHSGYPEAENLTVNWHDMPIHDARAIPGGASLASVGFGLVEHRSNIRDFTDRSELAAAVPGEIAEIVKAASGATEVLVSAGALSPRYSDRRGVVSGSERAARFCHNDFTPGSVGIHIVNEFPGVDRDRLTGRIAAYNLWRCISPPPQDMPLALCSPLTIAPVDVVAGEARYGAPGSHGVWGEVCLFRHNPAHRWFYFPNMTRDEVLIFAGYDSDPGHPSIVCHTAVDDPTCPADTPPRWNVDIRCYALFD